MPGVSSAIFDLAMDFDLHLSGLMVVTGATWAHATRA
jgi:hypothetical protein